MFDFLHKWLGIPPEEQPPNHYRLLGLCVFEDDLDVIDAAADKHLAFLHNLANGEYGEEAEDLSNKISSARLLLLNSKRKGQYDERLRAEIAKGDIKSASESAGRAAADSASRVALNPVPILPQNAPKSGPQVRMTANNVIKNKTPDVQPALISNAESVRVYGKSKPQKRRSKVGTTRRRRHVSWLGRLMRLFTFAAFAAVVYVGYGIFTGELLFDQDAFERMFTGAKETPTAQKDPQRSVIVERSVSGGLENAELMQPQPSIRDELEGDRGPSSEDSAAGQTQSNTSDEVSPKPAIPSDELIEQQISEILKKLEGNSDYGEAENDHPEEVAHYFFNRAVKFADEGNDKEGLAYFTLAYRKLLMLKRYQACLSVLDSISDHYAAYASRERKVDLIQEQLKLHSEVERSLFLACCELVEECAREGKFLETDSLLNYLTNSNFANTPQSKDLEVLEGNYREFKEAFDAKESVVNELDTVDGSPDNSADSESVGIFHCFYSNDWESGLKHLGNSEGVYEAPVALELALAPPIKIAEAWEAVWKNERSPLRQRAIGRRMITNYNKHFRAYDYKVPDVLRKKVDNLVEKVFPSGHNSLVWGERFFPFVIDDKTRAFGKRVKAEVSKSNKWNRSRFFSLMMPRGPVTGGAVAAIELGNVSTIEVTCEELGVRPGREAVLGFILDYHTPGGYVKRVFLRFDENYPRNTFLQAAGVQTIPWGDEAGFGSARPDRLPKRTSGKASQDTLARLAQAPKYTLVLRKWAPRNWDGRVWFMGYMKDAGPGYNLRCQIGW